jgi:hypothetical protein
MAQSLSLQATLPVTLRVIVGAIAIIKHLQRSADDG